MNDNGQIKKRRHRRKVCQFCVRHQIAIDYKKVDNVGRYVSDRGKILARRTSGACARHQRMVAQAIKRARFIGLLPHCVD